MEQVPDNKPPTVRSSLAVIQKIQTTIDGGYRISLDLSEDSLSLVQWLMDVKKNTNGVVLAAFAEELA